MTCTGKFFSPIFDTVAPTKAFITVPFIAAIWLGCCRNSLFSSVETCRHNEKLKKIVPQAYNVLLKLIM